MLLDAVTLQILTELVIHDVGRENQRQFPQFRKLLLRVLQRPPAALVTVQLAVRGASTISISSALLMNADRHRLRYVFAGDGLHLVAQLRHVLNVDGRRSR